MIAAGPEIQRILIGFEQTERTIGMQWELLEAQSSCSMWFKKGARYHHQLKTTTAISPPSQP
eukprot:4386573-Pyramimonas_sp.AAC.1